jgi:DNA primase
LIPKDTVDKIIETARVEDVVGDFITLKKRGANLLGLCPFHGEKSPSFTVSPAKGIYKCFGCGKAGNSVNFIMEHESLSYPEALRYLAAKYNIEIVEKEITPEEKAQITEKESLYIVTNYAQKYFTDNLWNTDEGKSVGLSYFRERGFTDEIIKKFQLGFSFEDRRAFSKAAIAAAYKPEYLVKTGLSILSDKHVDGQPITINDIFDRYTGRVIFPIHNGTGKVIGFGGRILNSDKKFAKYINSPQTDIYDKSKVLYGLYFAKKQITQEDNCYLVEGYTDVTSMHQAGIENVVASSGTSLTVDQIRLIHRFTNNITILYDGDVAGIKASFRGIDLILAEGMDVKVLLFPDGDDPDSFSKKVSGDDLRNYIKKNSNDFIKFKANLLYEEAKDDPVKKTELIFQVIESISLVPNALKRTEYTVSCSNIWHVDEQGLVIQIKRARDSQNRKIEDKVIEPEIINDEKKIISQGANQDLREDLQRLLESDFNPFAEQEKNLVRLLINYGTHLISIEHLNEENENVTSDVSVAEFVLNELHQDELSFVDATCQMFLYEFMLKIKDGVIPNTEYFENHRNPQLAQITINLNLKRSNDLLSDRWQSKHNIMTAHETDNIKKSVNHDLFIYKEKRLQKLLRDEKEKLRTASSDEEIQTILISVQKLDALKSRVNKLLGRTII